MADQKTEKKTNFKTRTGVVTSTKMDKTAVILLERRVQHPMYKKYITKHRKVYAHDAKNECQIGDAVTIVETRPISKLKRWRVVERHA